MFQFQGTPPLRKNLMKRIGIYLRIGSISAIISELDSILCFSSRCVISGLEIDLIVYDDITYPLFITSTVPIFLQFSLNIFLYWYKLRFSARLHHVWKWTVSGFEISPRRKKRKTLRYIKWERDEGCLANPDQFILLRWFICYYVPTLIRLLLYESWRLDGGLFPWLRLKCGIIGSIRELMNSFPVYYSSFVLHYIVSAGLGDGWMTELAGSTCHNVYLTYSERRSFCIKERDRDQSPLSVTALCHLGFVSLTFVWKHLLLSRNPSDAIDASSGPALNLFNLGQKYIIWGRCKFPSNHRRIFEFNLFSSIWKMSVFVYTEIDEVKFVSRSKDDGNKKNIIEIHISSCYHILWLKCTVSRLW